MTVSTVAALYDIHGNLPALEAVLAEVRDERVDEIIIGGDVMPGPMPAECLALLRAFDGPVVFLHGNGESAALEARRGGAIEQVPEAFRPAVRWSATQLPDEYLQDIAAWPSTVSRRVNDADVLFCHASPRNDTDIFTRLSPESRIAELFAGVRQPIAVCGHTHMQFDRMVGPLRVVNAGSVGMPFADPGAYWLLIGNDIQFRRTAYDITAAARRLRATTYPAAETFAAQVLSPRTEQEMLALYARSDGRGA